MAAALLPEHAATMRPLFRRGFPDASYRALAGHGSHRAREWLDRWRSVVERTCAWLSEFRRLRVPYDKRADIHEAFLSLGCALICGSRCAGLGPPERMRTSAAPIASSPFVVIASAPLLSGRGPRASVLTTGVTQDRLQLQSGCPASYLLASIEALDLKFDIHKSTMYKSSTYGNE